MSKKSTTPASTTYKWYVFSCAIGIFIAFLMFNDIIMAIMFGVPIGFLFGMTLQGSAENDKKSKK